MIIVYHNGKKGIEIANATHLTIDRLSHKSIAQVLLLVAEAYSDEILLWCHIDLKEQLNVSEMEHLFHHKKIMLSYNPSDTPFIEERIGYVDTSLFVKPKKEVPFATWQMSSAVGGIHASVLLAVKDSISFDSNFDYFLCSVAKLAMPQGLFCYSEPKLLKEKPIVANIKRSRFTLFRFVKQHYKTQWVFLLLLNMMLYERKFPVLPFLLSFFYKNRTKGTINLDGIEVQSSKKVVDKGTIDVIIPTIGRKSYLYDVLHDFAKQTILPNSIIIVEQNPAHGSKSELDYLTFESWPFEIQHIFTHQTGACNARNLALNQTQSEWVFLADDDNRFESNLIAAIFEKIKQYGNVVVTSSYLQKNEIKKYHNVIQWATFGAGNSFVRRDVLSTVKFYKALEFGYGEDGDFGMQLRNQGQDVLYFPEPEILHLKAPMGGFRTKPELQWQYDKIQPKPSPTIMLYQILHHSPVQINSYKTTLFFKYYRLQSIKNPLKYYNYFQKQWSSSVFWANQLKMQNEI